MTQASTITFAPKRAPWFKGVFALLILVLLAYGAMLLVEAQVVAGQGAAAVTAVPMPQVQEASPLVNDMSSLTQVLHVPGGYVDSRYQQ